MTKRPLNDLNDPAPKTPAEALRIYRRLSSPPMMDWLTEIMQLKPAERVELLAWMLLHLSNASMAMQMAADTHDPDLLSLDEAARTVVPPKRN